MLCTVACDYMLMFL